MVWICYKGLPHVRCILTPWFGFNLTIYPLFSFDFSLFISLFYFLFIFHHFPYHFWSLLQLVHTIGFRANLIKFLNIVGWLGFIVIFPYFLSFSPRPTLSFIFRKFKKKSCKKRSRL